MKYTTDKDLESSSNILACKALAQCNQRNANYSNSLLLSRKGKNLLEFEKNRKKQKKQPTIQPDTKGQVIVGNNELSIMKYAISIKSKLPKIDGVNVLGPVLATITKLKKKYRQNKIVSIRTEKELKQ